MEHSTSLSSPLSSEKISPYHGLVFLICFFGCVFGGSVSTLMSTYLPGVVRDLLGSQDQVQLSEVSAYINSLYILGWAIGGICWGMLSDGFGRAKCLWLSIGCFGLFAVLTSVAVSWPQIVLCRFLTGFGVGGVLVTANTLLAEIWPKETRAIFVGIVSIGFPIGIFSAGLINYNVPVWRQAFLIGAIPFAIALVAIFILKESEAWKKSRSLKKDATHDVSVLQDPVIQKNFLTGAIIFGSMLIGLWAIFSWLPTWIQSLVGSDPKAGSVTMMMLGGGGLLGGFLSGYISNILGMRKSMIICFSACFIISVLLFRFNASFSFIIYPEIAFLALFFGASQGILAVYIPLLFPTVIRATATGLCFNIGRFFTASVVFFVGWLVIALGGYSNALFIFSLIFLVGLSTVYVTKEVKN